MCENAFDVSFRKVAEGGLHGEPGGRRGAGAERPRQGAGAAAAPSGSGSTRAMASAASSRGLTIQRKWSAAFSGLWSRCSRLRRACPGLRPTQSVSTWQAQASCPARPRCPLTHRLCAPGSGSLPGPHRERASRVPTLTEPPFCPSADGHAAEAAGGCQLHRVPRPRDHPGPQSPGHTLRVRRSPSAGQQDAGVSSAGPPPAAGTGGGRRADGEAPGAAPLRTAS